MDIEKTVYYLLTKYGNATTYSLTRTVSSTYVDVNYPSKGKTKTTTTHTLLSAEGTYKESAVDGVNIKQSDTLLYVSTNGLSIEPEDTDVITNGSTIWSIVTVKKYKLNNSSIAYALQLRK